MNIAEFFISLGIKGEEKAIGAVKSVTGAMSKLWNSSTEAKVAIVGVFYELEQLFEASNKTGSALSSFSTLTGMSTKAVQEYNYAIQQATGEHADLNETIAEFTAIQKKVIELQAGRGGENDYLGMMFGALRGHGIQMDLKEINEWSKNVPLLIQRAQQFASLAEFKKGGSQQRYGSNILQNIFGDKKMVDSLINGGLTPDKIKAAGSHIFSEAEVGQLTNASRAWANMGTAMDMSVGRFNAKYGPEMALNIEKIVDALVGPKGLIPALTELSDKIKLFSLLNKTLIATANAIKGITELPDVVKGIKKILKGTQGEMALPTAPAGFKTFGFKQTVTNNVTNHLHTDSKDPRKHAEILTNTQKHYMATPTGGQLK